MNAIAASTSHPGGQRGLLRHGVDVPAEAVVVDELGECARPRRRTWLTAGHQVVLLQRHRAAQPRPQGAYGVQLGAGRRHGCPNQPSSSRKRTRSSAVRSVSSPEPAPGSVLTSAAADAERDLGVMGKSHVDS